MAGNVCQKGNVVGIGAALGLPVGLIRGLHCRLYGFEISHVIFLLMHCSPSRKHSFSPGKAIAWGIAQALRAAYLSTDTYNLRHCMKGPWRPISRNNIECLFCIGIDSSA